jgi:hypothetical protein
MQRRFLIVLSLGLVTMAGGCGGGGGQAEVSQSTDQHPPLSEQRPTGNEQLAPLNPQNPPLAGASTSGAASIGELCLQLCQKSISLGCDDNPSDCNEACAFFQLFGGQCSNELRALLQCALANVTTCAEDTVELACGAQSAAFESCTDILEPPDPPDPPTACTFEDACVGCATDCETCLCQTDQQAEFCTDSCGV